MPGREAVSRRIAPALCIVSLAGVFATVAAPLNAQHSWSYGIRKIGLLNAGEGVLWPPAHQQDSAADALRSGAPPGLVTAEAVLESAVYDNANRKIGAVKKVFIDPQSGRVERIGIKLEADQSHETHSVAWNQFRVMRRADADLALILDDSARSAVRLAGERAEIDAARLSARQIRAVQQQLKARGHPVGDISGEWNQQTESAIRNFQKAQGIPVSGRLNEQTVKRLGLDADEFRPRQPS